MTPSTSVGADGVALWQRTAGGGGGGGATPLIVPGAVVDEDLEPLARTRPVLFYDSRNRGRSDPVDDPGRLGFWTEVADADAVRSRAGLERASWLGWSYQAGIVAQHALAHPVRVDRLVLVSPMAPMSGTGSEIVFDAPAGGLARLDQMRAADIDSEDPERFCIAWHDVYDPMQVHDPASLARRRSQPCRHPNEWPVTVTTALAHVFVDLGIYDWRSALGQLTVPTLVVHGASDRANEAASVAWVEAVPDARLLVLEDVRRLPWLEAPEAFFDAVECFLAGAWPAAARR